MLDWTKYIDVDTDKPETKAVIANTRIPVELILKKLASGDTVDDLMNSYPSLTKENITACLLFAKQQAENSN